MVQTSLLRTEPPVHRVHISDAGPKDLEGLSRQAGLGLSLDEMLTIQGHYRKLGREPTDVELQALGQAWSEHCCYKSSKPVLRRHVYGVCEEKIICREDAGILAFDDDHVYAVKMESHNHPSAIEPYGGAATGVGGIIRDILCMGTQPIALIDPLFFGPPDLPYEKLPKGVKHPRYLFGGVVSGIRDYGNRIGVPTVAGSIVFHPRYTTNCLVNVGCVGIGRKEDLVHSSVDAAGDNYVLVGGRTGRDGIHGVTFASATLHEASDEESRGAVQLGDPITKEPVMHVCLEATRRSLLAGMKDLGGGGLSCVCGEMALAAGLGCDIRLDRVPTKEAGMAPWEIWVSESQERMMLAVKDAQLQDVLALCAKWDVEATVVGKATREKRIRVFWRDTLVLDLELPFIYEGPLYERPRTSRKIARRDAPPPERKSYTGTLRELLASPNISSRELVIRQYDHEVGARTALKPLQGKLGHPGPGDAAVLKPIEDSWRGLALTTDVNPWLTEIDPYWGAVSAVDEAMRNLAAVGARLDSIVDSLNFGNPEIPERMWEIETATKGLGDAAKALGVPFASGNVSLYNEGHAGSVPPTPAVLGIGIVQDIRTCVTTDLKGSGHTLFLVGETKHEMGGSEYYRLASGESTVVPRTDLALAKRASERVVTAIEDGLVRACHDVSNGGLAVTIAEMGIGGEIGARIRLSPGSRSDTQLFSESNTRWVIETEKPRKLEAHLRGIPLSRLGTTGGKAVVATRGGKELVRLSVAEAEAIWSSSLQKQVG